VKVIGQTIQALRRRGFTVLLVEQNLRFAAELADRHYVMETGRIVDVLTRDEMDAGHGRVEAHLGI